MSSVRFGLGFFYLQNCLVMFIKIQKLRFFSGILKDELRKEEHEVQFYQIRRLKCCSFKKGCVCRSITLARANRSGSIDPRVVGFAGPIVVPFPAALHLLNGKSCRLFSVYTSYS